MIGITSSNIIQPGWSPQALKLTGWWRDCPGVPSASTPWPSDPSDGNSGRPTFNSVTTSPVVGTPLNGHQVISFHDSTGDEVLGGGNCSSYINQNQFFAFILCRVTGSVGVTRHVFGSHGTSGSAGFRFQMASGIWSVQNASSTLNIMDGGGSVVANKWYLCIFNFTGDVGGAGVGWASGLTAKDGDARAYGGFATSIANFSAGTGTTFGFGNPGTGANSFGGDIADAGVSNLNLIEPGTCFGNVAQNIRNYCNMRYQLNFPPLTKDCQQF